MRKLSTEKQRQFFIGGLAFLALVIFFGLLLDRSQSAVLDNLWTHYTVIAMLIFVTLTLLILIVKVLKHKSIIDNDEPI